MYEIFRSHIHVWLYHTASCSYLFLRRIQIYSTPSRSYKKYKEFKTYKLNYLTITTHVLYRRSYIKVGITSLMIVKKYVCTCL
jgi:hypothetical protein